MNAVLHDAGGVKIVVSGTVVEADIPSMPGGGEVKKGVKYRETNRRSCC